MKRDSSPSPLVGEGWGGGKPSTNQRVENRLNDTVGVLENLVVPKPQDLEALTLEPFGPRAIGFDLSCVLSAIDLDHKACREAHEIDDIGSDGRLATEFMPARLAMA